MILLPPRMVMWCALMALVGLATAVEGEASRPRWVLEGDDFVLVTDASEKEARRFALGYAAYRQAYQAKVGRDGEPLPASRILLLRSQGDFEKLAQSVEAERRRREESTRLASMTGELDDVAFTAMALDGDREQALRLMFEFTTMHALERSGHFLPVWATQGAGRVLAGIDWRRDRIEIGEKSRGYSAVLRTRRWISWERFFEITTASPEYRAIVQNGDGVYHAQAWLLMDYVLMGPGGGRARFEQLAQALREQPWDLRVVQTVLGVESEKALERELRRHLRARAQIDTLPFDERATEARFRTRPATEAEWLVELSNLAVMGQRPWEAFSLLEEARQAEPKSVAVIEALARRELREGRMHAAVEYYREAIAAGSVNPRAYLLSARYRLEQAGVARRLDVGAVGPTAAVALAEVRRAIELNRGSAEAYHWLAHVLVVAKELPAEVVPEIDRGVVATAAGAATRYLRAVVRGRIGDETGRRADLRYLAEDPRASDDLRRRAQAELGQAIFREVAKDVQAAADAREFERAQRRYDEAWRELERVADGGTTADFRRLQAWLAENRDWHRLNAAFTARRWSECVEAAQAFEKAYPRSTLLARVRTILAEARAGLKADTI